jgi:hypothetical protein
MSQEKKDSPEAFDSWPDGTPTTATERQAYQQGFYERSALHSPPGDALREAVQAFQAIYKIITRRLAEPEDDSDTGSLVSALTLCEAAIERFTRRELRASRELGGLRAKNVRVS